MIRIKSFILIFFLVFCCVTVKKNQKQEVKKGFRYTVPLDMKESPDEARSFRYDNFIIEKGKRYFQSDIIIAIRHSNNDFISFHDFVKNDQLLLRNQVKIFYEEEWIPPGFIEKDIKFIAYQFYYRQQGEVVYQRSVYLISENIYYVVSLSSKDKMFLIDKENDDFWKSIYVD